MRAGGSNGKKRARPALNQQSATHGGLLDRSSQFRERIEVPFEHHFAKIVAEYTLAYQRLKTEAAFEESDLLARDEIVDFITDPTVANATSKDSNFVLFQLTKLQLKMECATVSFC
jgi:hypothetical protein